MTRKDKPVLFAHIDPKQHEALRRIAFEENRSMAEVAREAVAEFIESHRATGPRQPAGDPAGSAQGFLRRRAKGRNLVGELLRERRAEVRREARK